MPKIYPEKFQDQFISVGPGGVDKFNNCQVLSIKPKNRGKLWG